MKHYSAERKEAVLRKLAPPMNLTVPEVAEADDHQTGEKRRDPETLARSESAAYHCLTACGEGGESDGDQQQVHGHSTAQAGHLKADGSVDWYEGAQSWRDARPTATYVVLLMALVVCKKRRPEGRRQGVTP